MIGEESRAVTEATVHAQQWQTVPPETPSPDPLSHDTAVMVDRLALDSLAWRADHDELTRLPNRTSFCRRIAADLAGIHQQGSDTVRGALLILDLDGFKFINNSLGHETGDDLLRAIASRIAPALSAYFPESVPGFHLARIGGDQFGIWIPALPQSDSAHIFIVRLLHGLQNTIAQPIQIETPALPLKEVRPGGCLGIAVTPDDGNTVNSLLRAADTALYRAKESGRGSFRFHSPEDRHALLDRLKLEQRLIRAIETNGLELWYQPQVDVSSREMVGVEALLRWHDAELGNISPADFVPIAEELGLIHALGAWVLRTACQQIASWRREFRAGLKMCVNLSALQLVTGGERLITAVLEEFELTGSALELEMTEASLLRSGTSEDLDFLNEVRQRGVRLALDDFGTGYASLSYLRTAPVDVVKIDRGFITDIVEDGQTRAIVKAIIDLSHALGLVVTAEGVENDAQRKVLEALDCDLIQGFLFSRPIEATQIESLFRELGYGTA